MIKSWRNTQTRRFAEEGKKKPAGLDGDAAMELLAVLDAATSLKDLSMLRSVRLHKRVGGRRGQWSITVNGPWRICFEFSDGDAWNVEIVDYH
jgi:proteic killer suppression protein